MKNNKEIPVKSFYIVIAVLVLMVITSIAAGIKLADFNRQYFDDPTAREREFQQTLAKCEQFAEKYGDNWRNVAAPDDTCALIFQEYGKRLIEEGKRLEIDQAAAQEIIEQEAILQGLDIITPEPPDTE